MKTFFVLLIAVLLIITLFAMLPTQRQEYRPSKGAQLVNSISAKTAKIIMEKYNLKPCGIGVAMPGGPIQEITLCFDTKLPYSKEQLRVLLIKSAGELLNQVNSSSEIQEFIKDPPFSVRNIQIIIYNTNKDGREVFDPGISTAEISQEVLSYRTVDATDTFKFKYQYEESFEAALEAISNDINTLGKIL